MVFRIFVEKKKGLADEAKALKSDIISLLRITSLTGLRIVNRYDVENITPEIFERSKTTVFSEPQLDDISDTLAVSEGDTVFAVEYLPGQFDQRADSAAQCVQFISRAARPTVRSAKVYVLSGELSADEIAAIKKYLINPVESREASLETYETLATEYDIPESVKVLDGFRALDEKGLADFINDYSLAMDIDDIRFCRDYFVTEDRDPTITEIRMIDTYWSDHCRHTTFGTIIDKVEFEDKALAESYERYMSVRRELGRTKPVCLMDIGTIAAKYLKKAGKLSKLDESEEINACTVKIKVTVDGEEQDWLLLFKNETHNHPTEIEPFGGAATCIGGAIRDPLSGRSYVYAAMRVTGAGDPTVPVSETLQGKLPQRKIVTTAAAGYSSYGNQIGLCTGQVDEIYHSGYIAKRMEIGAVVGAAKAENVRRERPEDGDIVILLGGRTGRDGCGGATGSSKSHTASSLETCGAEVQKGNAPEERKLQRLFRNAEASRLIKRCNDFGAGGVSVAIGELADGLDIDLNAVPKKYEGLDGTELAISESQERMAVVVAADDVARFCELAASENLESTVVARVKADPRLTMTWNGTVIVDISRDFLNSNGAEKHITAKSVAAANYDKEIPESFADGMTALASDLNVCSKRGLSERFDSTIGAGSVFMPFGGKNQLTPPQAMAHKISVEKGHTDDASVMAWGYNPFIAERSCYHGAYLAVVESICKLIASGADFEDTYLTFQEYFERLRKDPERWGKPLAALLGALDAQLDYGVAAIGGKDSMSGSFDDIDVPPTLVSFAVTTEKAENLITPEFKGAGHNVYLIKPEYNDNNLPNPESLKAIFAKLTALIREGKVISAYTPVYGGVAEGVLKMTLGNSVGFEFAESCKKEIFGYNYGAFVVECADGVALDEKLLGKTVKEETITLGNEKLSLAELLKAYEGKLEGVYSCNIPQGEGKIEAFTCDKPSVLVASQKFAKPRVVIPVFPGTNCEYDSAKVFADAGAEPQILVIKNITPAGLEESVNAFAEAVKNSQMIFIPGGFSGGDEPDGSAKFITAFFRNKIISDEVNNLIKNRDGLVAGICNGFQALIKLGLVPYGEIIDTDENCPTLTFNTIGRHQSRIVNVRVASSKSPWLAGTKPGDIYSVPISHGEGRFLASDELIRSLAANGQIATQYVDACGVPTSDVHFNPNNSCFAIEGILSPDGRVLGKMGHAERIGKNLYKNVEGNYDMKLFDSAVKYYK
ncbi:MAG: phosphoribosylformylglycinamidine synthase [Clostridia bacterium]|nr:phosphoribosylformylglycinamidine synthase [Clostridia bacterium]